MVSLLARGVAKEAVSVRFGEATVDVTIRLEGGELCALSPNSNPNPYPYPQPEPLTLTLTPDPLTLTLTLTLTLILAPTPGPNQVRALAPPLPEDIRLRMPLECQPYQGVQPKLAKP